ncbi:fimbrial protein [Lysobacter arvi]|uniref:Fimbrial protein n=1 Tax=Lysobacter arvi TaxID=3038776 RepID=A0ABU1CGD6_9GAMM|nr:fimbrial protein [Lysobacter arvi]MDR0184018.1 fimbrial protein [Lysobacter arvi]
MSKTLICAALFSALGFTSLSAAAADGKITFTGTISDVTCTIKGGDNTNGGTSNFTVTLPSVSTTALAAAGQTAGDTPFSVIVGGSGQSGCKDGKIAKLWFETSTPTVDAANGGRLKNTASAGATNVLVGLLNKANAPIDLSDNTGVDGSEETIADNTATLQYTAQYYATGAAGAGDVNTYVNYSVVYN